MSWGGGKGGQRLHICLDLHTGVVKEFSSWGAFKLRGAVASAAACELRVVDIGHRGERE